MGHVSLNGNMHDSRGSWFDPMEKRIEGLMSNIGKRVVLDFWPYEGKLEIGTNGTIVSEYIRGFEVKWDGFRYPMGVRPEEVAVTHS